MSTPRIAYVTLAIGITILSLTPILGATLIQKFDELNPTYRITATWEGQNSQSRRSPPTLDDISQLSISLGRERNLTYVLETTSSALYKNNRSRVQVFGVDSLYSQFHHMPILQGSFLTSWHANQWVAVISEDLALALYRSVNVVGMEIQLYGHGFTVIGVAGVDRSILSTLVDRGYGSVFIPVRRLAELEPNPHTATLHVQTTEVSTTGRNAAELTNLLAVIGQPASSYQIFDYQMERRQLEQKVSWFNLAVGFTLFVILFNTLRRRVHGLAKHLRSQLQKKYVFEMICSDALALTIGIAQIAGILAGMLLLWRSVRFPLYIPPEYIPKDLLNLSFYVELLLDRIQAIFQVPRFLGPSGEVQIEIMNSILNWQFLLSVLVGLPLFYFGLTLFRVMGAPVLHTRAYSCLVGIISQVTWSWLLMQSQMPVRVDIKGGLILFTALFLVMGHGERGVAVRSVSRFLTRSN